MWLLVIIKINLMKDLFRVNMLFSKMYKSLLKQVLLDIVLVQIFLGFLLLLLLFLHSGFSSF